MSNDLLVSWTGKVISEEYSLEYGTDKIEMHVGAVEPGERAIIIDDLIATGGTLAAAIRLLGKRTNSRLILLIMMQRCWINEMFQF